MMITFEEVISTLTLISTLAVKLIGFPSQIHKVRKAGSIESVSVVYFVLGFVTYSLWTIHGIVSHDTTVIVGQGMGVLASGVLLAVLYSVAKKASSQKAVDPTK
jgi:uncharacterized protein with PQ loop repeat